MFDYRYLAKTTGSSISISTTYIVFVTKLQKRQILVIGFVITNKWSVVGFLFTCRNQNLDLISYVSVFTSKMKFILKFILIGADNIIRVKNMEISAYQINNVLRVYGEQLRRGRISNRKRSTDTNAPDKISISVRAERKTIIDDTTSKPKKKT